MSGACRRLAWLEADALLVVELVLCLLVWGPLPVAWLTVGGQLIAATESFFTGLLGALAGLVLSVTGTLLVIRAADHARLRLLAKAGQRLPDHDLIGIAMSVLAVAVGVVLAIWFFFVQGPGPLIGPR